MYKKIVIVSQLFYPDHQATSLLLTDLAVNLQDADNKITVICGFPNGSDCHQVKDFEIFQNIDIYRCGIKINSKAGLWQRLISYTFFLIHAGWMLLFIGKKSIVIGVTNPPFISILLAIVSAITGFEYHFIIHDIYPEGLVAVGTIAAESLVTRIWHNLNRYSYQCATKIVVLGRDMKDLLIDKYSLDANKIKYIPNWNLTPKRTTTPFEKNDLAVKLGIQSKFVVQYSGNMGLWHDINTFILAATKLQTNSNIQFLFIGDGIRKKEAYQLAEVLNLTNIIWMDFVPKEELSTSLACAHVALISLNTGLEGIAVPSKLYGILGSGKAILAQVPAKCEIAYTVIEEECGFVIQPGNINELVNKIEQLERDRNLTSMMGLRSFQAYKSRYTVQIIAQQFQMIMNLRVQSAPVKIETAAE